MLVPLPRKKNNKIIKRKNWIFSRLLHLLLVVYCLQRTREEKCSLHWWKTCGGTLPTFDNRFGYILVIDLWAYLPFAFSLPFVVYLTQRLIVHVPIDMKIYSVVYYEHLFTLRQRVAQKLIRYGEDPLSSLVRHRFTPFKARNWAKNCKCIRRNTPKSFKNCSETLKRNNH